MGLLPHSVVRNEGDVKGITKFPEYSERGIMPPVVVTTTIVMMMILMMTSFTLPLVEHVL